MTICRKKTDRLERYAKQTGLTINTSKTQVMSINTTPTAPVTINGEPLEFVQEITYLGSLISKVEMKRRRLRWLGHVLRMPGDSIPKVALRWTPQGKRKRRRPKMTWRQTVMAELTEMGLSWAEAQASAKDRTLWRKIVVALCPTGDEED